MIKNCNKKLQGLEECFAGSMQMVHLKKGFHKSGYIKWSRSDRVEKNGNSILCTGNTAQTYKIHKKNIKEYMV